MKEADPQNSRCTTLKANELEEANPPRQRLRGS